jgi:hypothetical protein
MILAEQPVAGNRIIAFAITGSKLESEPFTLPDVLLEQECTCGTRPTILDVPTLRAGADAVNYAHHVELHMFASRWTYLPTLAGYLEYTDLLKEWAKARQAGGQRMALLRDAAPAEGFRLQTVSYYGKLSDLDTVRGKPTGDTTVRDWINSTAPITRSIWQMEMFEIIAPSPTPPQPGEYLVRLRSYPSLGIGSDVRGDTVGAAKRLQARGFNVGAGIQHFARGAAISELEFSLHRLGEWEELSGKIFSHPDVLAHFTPNGAATSKPSSVDIWEVVIPAPPAKA